MRNLAFALRQAAVLVFLTSTSIPAAQSQFGSEKEARAMLEKAVAAVKANKDKALEMFNKGEHLQDIVGKKGYPLGKEIMQNATEGKISEVRYLWPRPGSETPLEKHTFYTKVAGQNCGVGFYKGEEVAPVPTTTMRRVNLRTTGTTSCRSSASAGTRRSPGSGRS